MDDIRVDPVSRYGAYGERQPPGSGKRRKQAHAQAGAERDPEDFFEASEPEPQPAERIRDSFAPSDAADSEY